MCYSRFPKLPRELSAPNPFGLPPDPPASQARFRKEEVQYNNAPVFNMVIQQMYKPHKHCMPFPNTAANTRSQDLTGLPRIVSLTPINRKQATSMFPMSVAQPYESRSYENKKKISIFRKTSISK